MANLAVSIGFKKQFDRAIQLFECALSILEATVGDMDSKTVDVIMGLGAIYYEKGQCNRAIELYERVLRLRISAGEEKGLTSEERLQFADMHFDTAVIMCNLAVAYSSKGQFDRAIAEA
jgi:tetratricopeptide (TPR) repeat protein